MSNNEETNLKGSPNEELELPELLASSETVRAMHETIDTEWDSLRRSACQTAAGRALWKHVVKDPVAEILAGASYLRSLHEKMRRDHINNAREVSGVILAVRTLWFDSKIEAAIGSFGGDKGSQVVLLGAERLTELVIQLKKLEVGDIGQKIQVNAHKTEDSGMDARAYRLSCLKDSSVFEVDFPDLLQMKAALLSEVMGSAKHNGLTMTAKSLIRVAADIREKDWLEKLQRCGFVPEKNTVWVLEGIIYYLPQAEAMQVLQSIASLCDLTHTVLLADFMNQSSTELSLSTFHFYSDWPEQLLPSLGFSHVKLSQIGDPDAHFGLMHDPLNLFNKLRKLPRSVQTHPEDGTPCRRLYLVESSGLPGQGDS
ncbi:hypothetical protein QJS10_CPB19g00560 [Acorus calamus]|uniref:S-adenosyl-L-methionine-dependent methyltransferase n=1 Tax=Acorus calamus TaxID=4465 RepID=A0AAV9CII5_ACOCL|nr:hypothetical protein QJS10_CPB19g00560 [Acorus calamus]